MVFQNQVILNLGGKDKASVINLDVQDGSTRWIAEDEWGASYSSPVMTMINKQQVCLVFAGGEIVPPAGGLLVIDHQNGKILSRFPWRSKNYESANAVPPVPGENKVFLSEYEKGGVILRFDSISIPEIIWQDPGVNIHWMTPIEKRGFYMEFQEGTNAGRKSFALI